MVRVCIDEINGATGRYEWWTHAEARSAEAPPPLRPLLAHDGPRSVLVTEDEADRILAWSQSLPGWNDPEAPVDGPHPLQFVRDVLQ